MGHGVPIWHSVATRRHHIINVSRNRRLQKGESEMKPVFLFLTLLSIAWLSASAEEPPIEIRVVAAQTQWEVNERTAHVLKITNRSAQLVTVPSFPNGKERDAGIAFYLKEHILKMEVVRDSKPISINENPQTRPGKFQPFPTVEIQPKETVSDDFSLRLTEPGDYTLTVTLDTTAVQGDKILKDRFTSPPVRFRIVPIATFRKQGANESARDYARARVAFYLHRIEEHKGEYFPNVAEMLRVQDAVPALIDALDSKDNQLAKRAELILAEIHHRGSNHEPPLPRSKPEWLDWWRREGVRLSAKELWSNFDSHHQ